jgi:hypothetical protein
MNENKRNCLILTQYRDGEEYNDFIGKFYHFPANENKNYSEQFKELPIEFVYYEPEKKGKGEFFGYGKITKPPFEDKRESGHCFVEISEYKPFSRPVSFKDENGEILEKTHNTKFYNSGNSVRKVNPEFLDGLCLDGGILLNFKADSHLIKILGEQLIGSEKVGILELIKNSIDAGASYCRIRFEKLPEISEADGSLYEFKEYPGPVILIEDDGSGMNRETIENGWLRPASTIKTNIKVKLKNEYEKAFKEGKLGVYEAVVNQLKKEHGGRIPLGEKGVGRFASHRLGRRLEIKTKTKEDSFEYVLSINWDDFDDYNANVDLDSIGVRLTRQTPSRNYGEANSGTQIIIFGGREGFKLDEKKIKEINQSIIRLNTPNPNPNIITSKFRAFIECPQIENIDSTEIVERFPATFSLDAIVNEYGIVEEYTLKFNPPKSVPLQSEEWSEKDYDLRKLDSTHWVDKENGVSRKPECGAFFVHIDSWYRVTPWIDGPDAKGMKAYLSNYGGISIYRDNIIICPAESGTKNDWLNLSQRHEKQAFRISYYNMIGNVEIDQSNNLEIVDKTSREGLIENRAYIDLAKLIETIIESILENRYIGKRDEFGNLTKGVVRDPKKLENVVKNSSIIIEGITNNYSLKDDPWQILSQLGQTFEERKDGLVNLGGSIKNLKKSIEIIEDIQERLTEHAGFGIAVAVSLHELTKITSNFYNGISYLLKSGTVDNFKLEDLKAASSSLKSELKRLSPLRAIRNEIKREFKISQSIKYASDIFKLKMENDGIKFESNMDDDFPVFARYSTLNQILGNLFDNSIYWLQSTPRIDRKIKILLNKEDRTLNFADNGSGIDNSIRPYLFEPGYSLKIPPSGLGLYICKTYMHSMNGDIHETTDRERIKDIKGAQFTLEFANVPVSKELKEFKK